METRCPNPECCLVFETDDRDRAGPCPRCGTLVRYRPLQLIREMERLHRQRLQAGRPARIRAVPGVFRLSALLEDVRSLWNVGSIFRTADGAGFEFLHLCGITGCPPAHGLSKTSLGAEDHVGWQHWLTSLEVLPRLAGQGVQIVALEETRASEPLARAIRRKAIRPPLCLVVGSETGGVAEETLNAASLVCHLPMRGVKRSLNVAVAFAVAAYALAEAVEEAEESDGP